MSDAMEGGEDARRQVMLGVYAPTRTRLRELAKRWEGKYHLGRGGIPDGLVDADKGVSMDRLINYLLDQDQDHQQRNAKSNAKRGGGRRKPAEEAPADGQ